MRQAGSAGTGARARRRAGRTVALAVAAAAMPAATAAAVPFGANLSQAPNIAPTCDQGAPSPPPVTGPWPGTSGFPTCTWTHGDATPNGQGLFPPASGVITRVSVRVGPVTGRMQPVVLRWFVQGALNNPVPNKVCCALQALGPVFTPAPGSVTTIPVNLPVTVEALPQPLDTRVAVFDQLALSVLDPGTPVPLLDTGQHGGATQALSPIFNNAFFPAYTEPTAAPRYSGGGSSVGGYVVLMAGELTPPGQAPAGGGPAVTPVAPGPAPLTPVAPLTPAVPAATLPAARLAVRRGLAPVVVACGGDAACVGQVLLTSRASAGAGARARAAAAVVYGRASFRLAAGRRGTVRVRLNAKGRALLARRPSARVWAQVALTGGGSPAVRQVTLTRP